VPWSVSERQRALPFYNLRMQPWREHFAWSVDGSLMAQRADAKHFGLT
jgi:hypothetical protein